MLPKTQVLSIVTVLDHRDPGDFLRIVDINNKISKLNISYEIVVIDNRNRSDKDDKNISSLSLNVPNLQIFKLKNVTDHKTASLAGIENAIGDWVLSLDIYQDSINPLEEMLESAIKYGTEIIIGANSDSLHLLSRTIVNNILQHEYPLIALNNAINSQNLKKTIIPQKDHTYNPLHVRERLVNSWKIFIGKSLLPLRVANISFVLASILAILYSLSSAPVTVLIISILSFFMSVSLLFISEYLIILSDPHSRKPNYEIAERLSSNIQARNSLTNIEVEN